MNRYYNYILFSVILFLQLSCKNKLKPDELATDSSVVSDTLLPKAINLEDAIKNALDSQRLGEIPASEIAEYLYAAPLLREIYAENKSIWLNDNGTLNDNGKKAVDAIRNAYIYGLDNQYYHFPAIDSTLKTLANDSTSLETRADAELSISNALCLLALHLTEGAVDTAHLLRSDFSKSKDKIQQWFKASTKKNNWEQQLKTLEPQHMHYRVLSEAIRSFKEIKNVLPKGFSIPDHKTDSAACAAAVIQALQFHNYLPDSSSILHEDYQKALKNFQSGNGLVADGVPGANTRMFLLTDQKEKYRRIALNMDKWRRVAHELPQEYIWANIAGFEAYVVSHDTLVRTHKVIVGNPKTKTPEIISNINIVVLNPDWSVPYSIIKNEMRHKSAGYLSKYNIYQDGKKVSPGQVKWGKSVRIVQPPGDNNALGYIKFLFPNSHSVYLHDTPSRNLFANSVRAYSHGCVRVHEPLLLGEYLLKRDGKDIGQDSIQSIIATHKTINYTLKNTMPVYLLYFTANVNSKNELVLYPDIYKKEDYDVSVLFNGHYKIPANTRKLKKTVPGKDIRQKEASEADSNVIAMQAEKRVLYAMF